MYRFQAFHKSVSNSSLGIKYTQFLCPKVNLGFIYNSVAVLIALFNIYSVSTKSTRGFEKLCIM
jgi:hypothetical protein